MKNVRFIKKTTAKTIANGRWNAMDFDSLIDKLIKCVKGCDGQENPNK